MSLAVELVVKGTSRNRTGATVIQTPEATITPWLHRMPCRNRTGSNRVAGGHATTTSMAYHSCRSSCSREGATAESNRVLGRHNPRCYRYTSCPELSPPGIEPGSAELQSDVLPLHQGEPTHRLRLLPFILSSFQGAAAESNRVLRSFNPPCSQYTSCPELPLPDSNRGRPRDNRPCYPYTKGDRTPSYSSVAVHLVVDPPPTGTRPQGAFVLSCDPFGTHWIAVRFLSRIGGGIYK